MPSWFQNFNKELIDSAAFSEHEAFDHPVACKTVFSLAVFSYFPSICFIENELVGI